MSLKTLIPTKPFTVAQLFQTSNTFGGILMYVITVGLIALLMAGVYNYITIGHEAYNVYRQHPWGLLLGMYVFFVVSSTGLCIISSLGHVFGIKAFEVIGKRAILGAIVTILSGFIVIGLELGHPIVMLQYNILSPNLTSAVWWMGTLYTFYLIAIMFEFYFLQKDDHHYSKIFGIAGLLVGVAAHSNLGAVFGFLVARPISNGVFYPIYFILSAMITGAYILFLLYGFKYRLDFSKVPQVEKMLFALAKVLALLLGILLFFELWRFLTSLYGGLPERANTALHVIHSKEFIIGEVIMGMLIPFLAIMLTGGKNLKLIFASAIIGMVGIYTMRYNLIHDTLAFPMQTQKIMEYQLAPDFAHYFPSFTEIAIAIGALGVCFFLYHVADKVFDLGD